METELVYAAISANRGENILACRHKILLYSRCNAVIVQPLRCNPLGPQSLHGHTGTVNGQQFVHGSPDGNPHYCHIISTAQDNTAIIWKLDLSYLTANQVHRLESPDGHTFLTRCCYCTEKGQFRSITTTIDGSINFWLDDKLQQTLKETYYCFDAKLHRIQQTDHWLLFLGASDNKIHVFQVCESSLEHMFDLSGHSDWIKSLDTFNLQTDERAFLLASGSQDTYIRVWYLRMVKASQVDPAQVRTSSCKILQEPRDLRLTATLETVIARHEGIVHGVCWFKEHETPMPKQLQLLSCSADKTLAITRSTPFTNQSDRNQQEANQYDQSPASAEVWRETYRLGETGETNLPFLSVCLSEDEYTLYASSLRGAIHSWKFGHHMDTQINKYVAKWTFGRTYTGHYEPVTDLVWERNGAYLLSCSLDKTVRLHSQCEKDGLWHELARPQVHGHEINCLASLGPCKFATGAEEKTIRLFEATQFFVNNFKALAERTKRLRGFSISDLPAHAQLPALGLSSKGSQCPYDLGQDPKDNNWYMTSKLVEDLAKLDHLDKTPSEEILLQSTLWWEYNKLFGHSNELHALDATSSFLASASKANRADLARVVIWDTDKFRKVATIEHHTLTVTRLKFSPNERFLLSVSRDRTWCLSEKTSNPRYGYEKILATSKATAVHERIIWDCCWTYDSCFFMTVSRDKKAVLWSIDQLTSPELSLSDQAAGERIKCLAMQNLNHSIQAVDCSNQSLGYLSYLFAFGLEDGTIEVHTISLDPTPYWQQRVRIDYLHYLPIRRLAFSPSRDSHLLASAADDCIVRLSVLKFSQE